MKYQLVVQSPEELWEDIDVIAYLEDRLDESLVNAEVDGHDIGSGEVNIFIHTNDPNCTCKEVKDLLEEEHIVLVDVKIAYREIGTEKYIALWPEGLADFSVK